MKHKGKAFILAFSWLSLTGCAVLHHAQVGEIDNRNPSMKWFDVKVSETGINVKEAGKIVDAMSRSKDGSAIADIIQMFQFGPRTGNPVFNENYARNIVDLVLNECPSGKVTGVTSIREMRKYPVVSGEIVKVTGWCIQ